MPVEKLNRYKKTMQLGFCNDTTEQKFQQFQLNRGRSTASYSLSVLAIINLVFAFMEHWILGINSSAPLLGYIFVALVCISLVFFSALSTNTSALKLRILIPGFLTLIILMLGLYLQSYRLYHGIEITLLVIWIGSLNVFSFRQSAAFAFFAISVFALGVLFLGTTTVKVIALIVLLVAAYSLALYLSYMLERFRRMLFLTNQAMEDVYARQESWAFTLIDLDIALSGILDFRQLIGRLMEHIKSVIEYDSYVLTSLDGKGPKPEADEIDGTLFEEDDKTIWSDELLTKLAQTRQASVSAEFDLVKGFLGKEKKNFKNYRLDIPVFKDSSLVGVVSLKRESLQFDDLDMTASVSIATQAMMIFSRSINASLMSAGLQKAATRKPVIQVPEKKIETGKESSSPSTDIDLTVDQAASQQEKEKVSEEQDVTVVPSDVVKQMKEKSETARKTITLLSRENAEHVSMDRYRTAAVEGEPLSLLLVEVDGLSAIREKEGDQSAYKVFAGIVKYVFSRTDKETDVLGRYGQNGFSVLLPRVDMNAAEKFAEKLREYTESTSFKTPYGERNATLSIGVAAITDETGNHESMVKRADMALFVAKKNGRNCVKVRL